MTDQLGDLATRRADADAIALGSGVHEVQRDGAGPVTLTQLPPSLGALRLSMVL